MSSDLAEAERTTTVVTVYGIATCGAAVPESGADPPSATTTLVTAMVSVTELPRALVDQHAEKQSVVHASSRRLGQMTRTTTGGWHFRAVSDVWAAKWIAGG